MSQDPWAQTSHRLQLALAALDQDDTLVLCEVSDAPPQHSRTFRRERPAPVRFVQFRRDQDLISGECVGATSWGGYYAIDEDQDRRLRDLGWKAPDQLPDALRDSPNYRVDAPQGDVATLVRMAVGAFEVLGLSPAAELDWQRY